MPALVSCIILTYNSRSHLPTLLQSIRDQKYPRIEVIVVDNASSDDTISYLKTQQILPIDQLICNSTNEWFARGNNRGIHNAHGEYIFVCNDDVVLTPTFLEILAQYLDSHPTCGMIGGKLLKLHGSEYRGEQLIDSAGLMRHRSYRMVNRGEQVVDHGQYDRAEEVFGITGAAMLLRREALEAVRYNNEYFDEDFIAYKEDCDLSWRIRRLGFTIWYEPKAVAYHARSVQQRSLQGRKNISQIVRAYSYRNHLWMLIKNIRVGEFFISIPWILPYECGKLAYILVAEWSTLRTVSTILHGIQRMIAKRHHYGTM